MDVWLPGWLKKWLQPARYKTAYGGRASGKTWGIAHLLIILAAQNKTRVACCREFQESIAVSAKPALETAIQRLNMGAYFKVTNNTIDGYNGSHFFFKGMERNRESIRGWEDVDIAWVEEAQRMSAATANILTPTIRKPGSEIWLTWNPENRTDWVWIRFIIQYEPGDTRVIRDKVNFDSNPFCPPEAHEERLFDKKWNPELYRWKWLGEPNDEGGDRNILPYTRISQCVEGWHRYMDGEWGEKVGSWTEAGLDIADQGTDWNALTLRRGPAVLAWLRWRAENMKETTLRADHILREQDVKRLFYDATGLGANYRVFAGDIANRPYVVRPELFGGEVRGKETLFSYKVLNKEFFAKRNIQMAWNLRLRAENTNRLLQGDKTVRLDKCLFLPNKRMMSIEPLWEPNAELYQNELGQPTWRNNPTTGKTELIKREEEDPSPDMFDATMMAFAKDSENGLQAR